MTSVALLAEIFLVFIIYLNPYKISPILPAELHSSFNATLNGLSLISLLIAFYFIKKKEIFKHKFFIHMAMFYSALFLISYILYHLSLGHFVFNHPTLRPYYLLLLVSHLVMSFVALPMIFITYTLGLLGKVQDHKKFAMTTFLLWSYVSFTGVLVVLFIKLFHQQIYL